MSSSSQKAALILESSALRITKKRIDVLNVLIEQKVVMSQSQIEKKLPPHFDRVTLYRSLQSFLDSGIIHKVPDSDEGTVKYALCSNQCNAHKHQDEHLHFKCIQCKQTTCIKTPIPVVSLPSGFSSIESHLLIKGTCRKCNTPY